MPVRVYVRTIAWCVRVVLTCDQPHGDCKPIQFDCFFMIILSSFTGI